MAAHLLPKAYPLCSEDEAWTMVCSMLERDCPVPERVREFDAHRALFRDAYARVQREHDHTSYKYFRTENGRGVVNPLYVDHYAKLLHAFSFAMCRNNADRFLLDTVFLSIKTRTGMDLFYEVELPEYFLPIHAHGTILGRAKYGRFFTVLQGCTVGNNKDIYPAFGEGVTMHPHSAVLGNCHIGKNVRIATGALVIDRDIPENSIVMGRVPDLVIKPNLSDNIAEFFDVPRP